MKIDDDANRAQRIADMVNKGGLGYGEAQLADDTAVHAAAECARVLMDTIDRNMALMNASDKATMMAKMSAMMMVSVSMDVTLRMLLGEVAKEMMQ